MKTLLIIFLIIIAHKLFAQDDSPDSLVEKYQRLDYYALEGDYIIHYFVDIKSDTLLYDLSLKNGNTITFKGEVISRNGKIIFLKEGECVDSKGNIGKCNKIRKKLNSKISK
jgi:hypothetical protein